MSALASMPQMTMEVCDQEKTCILWFFFHNLVVSKHMFNLYANTNYCKNLYDLLTERTNMCDVSFSIEINKSQSLFFKGDL